MTANTGVALLGHPASEHVRVEFVQRTHPSATDYWDGNWVAVRVRVRVGGFDARAQGDLRADELASFHRDLVRLHASLAGEARFTTMEDWLSLRLVGDGRGHVEVRGQVRDQPGIGNLLDFGFKLDQTDLQGALSELEAVCRAFPVVGAP
jgi:hypothetical protein